MTVDRVSRSEPVSRRVTMWLLSLHPALVRWGWLGQHILYHGVPSRVKCMLFVCKGNICRSPLAEAYAQRLLARHGLDVRVRSVGIDTTNGKPPHRHALAVAQRHGCSLRGHSTEKITALHVQEADLILAMEFEQVARLRQMFPEAACKMFLLGEGDFNGRSVVQIYDPFGKQEAEFESCFQRIRKAVDFVIQQMLLADGRERLHRLA